MQGEIKVFQMNDCDWMAARTLAEAIESYRREYSGDDAPEMYEEARELPDEAMDRLKYCVADDSERVIEKITFREQLNRMVAENEKFPCFFASTEY